MRKTNIGNTMNFYKIRMSRDLKKKQQTNKNARMELYVKTPVPNSYLKNEYLRLTQSKRAVILLKQGS